MKRIDWWLGIGVLALVFLLHAAIPRYELIAPSSSQSRPAEVPYGDFYGAARYPTVVKLDRWTGAVYVGSLISQIEAAPKWVWVRLESQ
jgi:hypothetical protein